ncbi:MAG: hypothetical protein ACLQLG_17650 [Thermoguttaceae bacterium]
MNAHDPKLAESLLKLLSQEQRGQRRSEETPLNVYERLTAAMILEIPWCHGDLAKEIYKGTNVGKYDECSAELRDEELLLAAAGEKFDQMEEIKNLTVPLSRDGAVKRTPDGSTEK